MTTPESAFEALTPALPLMATLFGGGALVTLIGTLLAGRFQSNREHQRWLAGKRLEAYYEVLRFVRKARLSIVILNHSARSLGAGVGDLEERIKASARDAAMRDPENWQARIDESIASFREEIDGMHKTIDTSTTTLKQVTAAQRTLMVTANDVLLPLTLLGPATVGRAGDKLLQTLTSEDDEEWGRALQRYIDAMRRVLKTVR